MGGPVEALAVDPSSVSPSLPQGLDADQLGAVVGWISVTTKDGDLLIRPCAPKNGAPVEEGREEGGEEIACVTLSTEQWQLLHQDKEALVQRVTGLRSKLDTMGRDLLQSFEMKSVLIELQAAASRAQERCERITESLGMTSAELERDRIVAEGRGRGELDVLRGVLRQIRGSLVSATADPTTPETETAENLYKIRISDLENTVADLQEKVTRASVSEVALRRSIDARRSALRNFLLEKVLGDLSSVQCGPISVRNHDAERDALHAAVEAQLRWNLELSRPDQDVVLNGDTA